MAAMRQISPFGVAAVLAMMLATAAAAADAEWPRFLGPGGRASAPGVDVPLTWGEDENLLWKAPIGAGSSSPVVAGGRVFVTGYEGAGDSVVRTLHAFDLESGKELWRMDVANDGPEDVAQGFLTEHGYASNTPVTDGEAVYAFFGKMGVYAVAAATGQQRWHADVGKGSASRQWGSGASLVLAGDRVIVNAADEARAVFALDAGTGETLWRADAAELAYNTPAVDEAHGEVIVAIPGEVRGLSLKDGGVNWFAETVIGGNVSPSPILHEGRVTLFGGIRAAGSQTLPTGGFGNMSGEDVWTSRTSSYVATPLLYDGHFYWIDDRGVAYCMRASDGETVYRERVEEIEAGGRPVYASPVLAGERIYVQTRFDGTLVLPAEPRFEVLARNRFAGDDSDFSGTPAVAGDSLLLRSGRFLYRVGE